MELEEDAPGAEVEVLPVLTVKVRTKTGVNDDGDPVFSWTTLVEGPATLWEQREEGDDIAGATRVKAKATMLYDGNQTITESAMVLADTGGRFRVTSVAQVPGHVSFDLERMSDG